MTAASSRGWGSGWPNCQPTKQKVLVRKDGLRIPVRSELLELVSILMDLTEALGYDIIPQWTWGYACRAIAGTSIPSNHSWGLAVDINAPINPQSRVLVTNIPKSIQDLWKNHGFRWGGNYSPPTKYDPMHFEFMESPIDAARHTQNLKNFLSGNGGVVKPAPAPNPNPPKPAPPPIIRKGDTRKNYVILIQTILHNHGHPNLKIDGDFGDNTVKAVKELQHFFGVTEDGVVGPTTWGLLALANR